MKVIDLDEKKFEEMVINNKEEMLVDFYADWCGPCKMMALILESVAEDDNSFKVARINTDDADELSRKYGVMSIPNFKFFKGGQVVDEALGAMPATALTNKLDQLL